MDYCYCCVRVIYYYILSIGLCYSYYLAGPRTASDRRIADKRCVLRWASVMIMSTTCVIITCVRAIQLERPGAPYRFPAVSGSAHARSRAPPNYSFHLVRYSRRRQVTQRHLITFRRHRIPRWSRVSSSSDCRGTSRRKTPETRGYRTARDVCAPEVCEISSTPFWFSPRSCTMIPDREHDTLKILYA